VSSPQSEPATDIESHLEIPLPSGAPPTSPSQWWSCSHSGLTNPQIGAQLFLSPHTVEWHLRRVYPKLGISSHKELRNALPTA